MSVHDCMSHNLFYLFILMITYSISVSFYCLVYHRKYLKIQDVLANVGGIIKVLQIVGSILTAYVVKLSFVSNISNELFSYNNENMNLNCSDIQNMRDQRKPQPDIVTMSEVRVRRLCLKKPISIKEYLISNIFKKRKNLTQAFEKIINYTSKKLELGNLLRNDIDI
jgi:hypothetical protein